MDVSIIIVNWNTCEILKCCLESIFNQTTGIQFETIVVDNGSIDESVTMVTEEFPQVILIQNCNNKGFAAANNQGIAIAKGNYLLLLNSDTIILDGAIQKCLSFAVQHPEAGVVGCRVLNEDYTLQPTCFKFPSALNLFLSATYLYKLFPQSSFFGREQMSWWKRNTVEEVEVVTGCFMLAKKALMQEVDGFDESFYIYGEETDLCYRMSLTGWKSMFTPDGVIIHLGGASSKKIQQDMILQTRAGILYFIAKHRSRPEYFASCLLMSLHAFLRVPFWLWKLAFSSNKKESAIRVRAYLKSAVCAFGGWRGLQYRAR